MAILAHTDRRINTIVGRWSQMVAEASHARDIDQIETLMSALNDMELELKWALDLILEPPKAIDDNGKWIF